MRESTKRVAKEYQARAKRRGINMPWWTCVTIALAYEKKGSNE